MKNLFFKLMVTMLLLSNLVTACGAPLTPTTSPTTSPSVTPAQISTIGPSLTPTLMACASNCSFRFIHPGALDSKGELTFVKAQIQAGEQPWKDEYDKLQRSSAATRIPHGLTHINSNDVDATTSRDDAIGAYSQALLWYYSGDDLYAERATAILNSWSNLQGFTAGSEQDKLQAGWIGAIFAYSAEIMREYPGWTETDIANLQTMFERAFYPQLNTASFWNGNVDLTQIDAMMAIAVFNEDEDEFNTAIERWHARTNSYFYLESDVVVPSINGDGGYVQGFWSNPTAWIDGLTQETCRDNGHHTQFAIGSALHAAEVAWHQGVDLYKGETERYTAALELLATQLLTGDMQGICANNTAQSNDLYDTWEIGFNHYHNRMGIDLPQTDQLIRNQIRPKAPRAVWNLVYETLTHAGN